MAESGIDSTQNALQNAPTLACGYRLETGTYTTWPNGYQAWVKLVNVSGATAVESFEVLLDVGDTSIQNGYQASFGPADGGYVASAPSYLKFQKIAVGQSYQFGFIGAGTFDGITAYITSVNGVPCDVTPPVVDLQVNEDLFTSDGTLTLTAEASDDVAVRKVVFSQDGEILGEDREPPYSLDVSVSDALNGRHVYTATAVDPNGNEGSDSERVLVAIGNRFLGTAADIPADYTHIPGLFDQLTPENGGKWGVVEATRDSMNFAELDAAYALSEEQGIPFKLHTLVWGLQQPEWLAALSPEEQLEEIHEWFAALRDRYENVPLIDVVNEPLHSTPSYAGALGGAGETGYDWMIRSFELAREYFPHSELILNDYQVLIYEGFTADYLELVQLLQDRGLIDGIGLQGHFLERADVSVVETNLATLAATGLPIYISEFDVNLASDAHHANVVRDLFTVFWDNPSVLGVTHWGHLQGSTWQQNAYLIRTDGSHRPGLDFMICTVNGGTDCPVPEYVPEPRVGGEFGITLEAEEYDDAQGLFALGNTVAFTDAGDWFGYADVVFRSNYDKFKVRYAKGNTSPGSVSIHLDSLDSAPVLTVDLPPTAGWGTFQTIEVPWVPVSGHHAVYVEFGGGFGVGNVDNLWFGTDPPPEQVNLVSNGDFENGNTSGWFGWGGTISNTTARAHSGTHSLVVTNRAAGAGTAAVDLTSKVQSGKTYAVTFWVSIGGAPIAPVNITRALNCGSGTTWEWVANSSAVADGVWTKLSGNVTIPPDCAVTQLQIYAEGPPAGVDLYVDDVVVSGPPDTIVNLLSNGDFESNLDGWFGWGGTRSLTTTRAKTGLQSLLVTDRQAGQGTAATDVTSLVVAGKSYRLTFWVTVGGAATAPVNITRQLNCGGSTTWVWVANSSSVADGVWTELAGDIAIPADCALQQLQVYAEGPNAGVDLYVDGVVLSALP